MQPNILVEPLVREAEKLGYKSLVDIGSLNIPFQERSFDPAGERSIKEPADRKVWARKGGSHSRRSSIGLSPHHLTRGTPVEIHAYCHRRRI